MTDAYALSRQSVDKIKQDLERLRTQVANLEHGRLRAAYKTPQRDDSIIGKATASVAARSGTACTSGNFKVQNIDAAGTLSDSARVEEVFNLGDESVSSGDYLQLERDYRSGRWVTHAAAAGTGGGGSSVREISYVKAQGYWTFSSTPLPSTTSAVVSSVQVKKCDLDGTESGSTFTCYLPITNTGNDPNVVPGQIFLAAETEDPSDSTTSWSGISGYEDAAIGTIRMVALNEPPNPESGWAEMNGTDNSDPGSGIDMSGAVPKHDCSVTAGTDNGGVADPSTTSGAAAPGGSTGTGTTGSSGVLTTDASTGTTGSAGSHSHATGSHTHTVSVSGTTGSASGTSGGSGVLTTSDSSAGISSSSFSTEFVDASDDMSTEVLISFDDSPGASDHNHTVPDHSHSFGSHSHTFSDSATTSSSSGSTSTSGSHSHSIGSHDHDVPTHTHSIPALSVSVNSHTHTVQKQKTKTLCFFERIDNSDWP